MPHLFDSMASAINHYIIWTCIILILIILFIFIFIHLIFLFRLDAPQGQNPSVILLLSEFCLALFSEIHIAQYIFAEQMNQHKYLHKIITSNPESPQLLLFTYLQ